MKTIFWDQLMVGLAELTSAIEILNNMIDM